MNDSEMDTLLIEEGRRWRHTLSPPQTSTPRPVSHRRSWALVSGVAAAATAAVIGATLLINQSPKTNHPEVSAVHVTTRPAFVQPGTQVTGTGALIKDTDGTVRLCREASRSLVRIVSGDGKTTSDVSPECSGAPVTVVGVDEAILTTLSAGSDFYQVDGTWTGDHLTATGVTPAKSLSHDLGSLPLPCSTPSDGWQTAQPSAVQVGQVTEAVNAKPGIYSGTWNAGSGENGINVTVVAVAHGDTSVITKQIKAYYTGNLCVTSAKFSTSERETFEKKITAQRPNWFINDDPVQDAATVTVPAYTATDEAILHAAGPVTAIVTSVLSPLL